VLRYDDAVSSGRVAILGLSDRTLEWVTPVLYLRGHDTRLFTQPKTKPRTRFNWDRIPRVEPTTMLAVTDVVVTTAGVLAPGPDGPGREQWSRAGRMR
jgi:hypothetical protein